MSNPFTNPDSFVSPSMNQVRLVDLPGLQVPLAWQNKSGYQLLGKPVLEAQIRQKTVVLHLNPESPDLIRQFDTCFESQDEWVRETAVAIAQEYGRKLAYHQLVLKRGDVINRVVRPAWQDEHWAHWAQIERVWLGGGLMAGNLGKVAAAETQAFIRQHGFPAYTLQVSDNAANLPLLGAARVAPSQARSMLVFDFGQTSIKRGVAHYEAGHVSELEPLATVPANCYMRWVSKEPHFAELSRQLAEKTLARLLQVIDATWAEAKAKGCELSDTIAVILACYLLNGQPRPEDWGCYGRLQQFSSHLQTYLTEQVSSQLDQPVQIRLLHDGQAAALPYAGKSNSAVMTFGTAIGIGFPPRFSATLRPFESKSVRFVGK